MSAQSERDQSSVPTEAEGGVGPNGYRFTTHDIQHRSSVTTLVTVLWAVHERYRTPHVVRAWSQALEESYGLEEDIEEAKTWMEGFGDEDGWTYWTTHETIPVPIGPPTIEECR